MSERDELMESPTKRDVEERLSSLVSGNMSRESAAAWATRWVVMKNPKVDDPAIWKALTRISGADIASTDRRYLYDENDFNKWLKDLRAQ